MAYLRYGLKNTCLAGERRFQGAAPSLIIFSIEICNPWFGREWDIDGIHGWDIGSDLHTNFFVSCTFPD